MKTLKVLSVGLLIGTAAFGLSGCSKAQKGAASGGVIGAIAGIPIANATGGAPATGAVIGGASGAAVGGLAGDAFDQVSKADRQREMENLQAQLWEAEDELASLRTTGLDKDALAQLQAAQAEVNELRAALDSATAESEQLALTRSAMNSELLDAESRIAELEGMVVASESALLEKEADYSAAISEKESVISAKEAELAQLQAMIDAKEAQLASLGGEVEVLRTSLNGKEQKLQGLSDELNNLNVQLEETSRGLTLTIVDSLLYQPGESTLTDDGAALVGEVATIINNNFPGRELLIEGHTDNQPIVRSGWRSNWELGAARALTLLHELVQSHGVDPSLVSATTMGEFRPAATNNTTEGRRANRRAVIVILPEKLPLQRESLASLN